jgi:hypothetical protein
MDFQHAVRTSARDRPTYAAEPTFTLVAARISCP